MEFPFQAQIYDEDPATATALAEEISAFLEGREVTKPSGDTATVIETKIDFTDSVNRIDGRQLVQVSASFDDDEVSALVVAAQEAVEGEFDAARLSEAGVAEDALEFDFGQESENAESFNSLGIVFPVAILLMFIVLAVLFRSILQPILIFLAIPFSFLGVVVALLVTDNALSFFSMIGAIGLIGIAVNNTIMLTDYANQAKAKNKGLVEALAIASQERFRPLITTTLTTVVALLPLAIFDPFWQPLAVVIIGGLISSTVLVILSFPYYYFVVALIGNWIRGLFRRK